MDKWKSFFQSSGSDIWTVIDKAITIAAVEHPAELRARRDRYTEKMFCPTAHLTGLCECDDDDADHGGADEHSDGDDVSETKVTVHEHREDEEDEEASEDEEDDDVHNRRKKPSYLDDVEALSEEVEEESRRIKEVNRLKNRLSDPEEEEEYLYEALENLDNMQLSFEVLKATGIGRPVSNLRKHPSSRIGSFAKHLISSWKTIADEWTKSAERMTKGAPSGRVDDDFGLPSPPVDEGELLAAGIPEVNKLYDFIGDDISAGSEDINEKPRRGSSGDWVNGIYEEAHSPEEIVNETSKVSKKVKESETKGKRETSSIIKGDTRKSDKGDKGSTVIKGSSSSNGKLEDKRKGLASDSSRLKAISSSSTKPKLGSASSLQKRSEERTNLSLNKDKTAGLSTEKLAATKRKVHAEYQQAENAKRQRTVQVMELTDLPKGRGGPKAAKPQPKGHVQHNNRYMSRR